ncbi:hypothetical protein [Streptoalloteichus tenebrarius]|uniref:hypothetical protein n=1 Tax=Streptoalloteichus tenebrarius (strain ATCC 17920 / DSM 40477 / JCM 4838 / CBS 697.72 / NBRC 16177 / NCIMB 11028 / NRRL B-12390 / A12253. 1 / ISP 5477) TaxID=1933 RepID=UPI0020A447C5|nr:hypothetical protein [Streptoalloteichus tenebrarius]
MVGDRHDANARSGLRLALLVLTLAAGVLAMHQIARPSWPTPPSPAAALATDHRGHHAGDRAEHHAGSPGGEAALGDRDGGLGGDHGQGHGGGHGTVHTGLHLCLGLVVTALGLLVLRLLGRTRPTPATRQPALAWCGGAPPPERGPPTGSLLLPALCVWRL